MVKEKLAAYGIETIFIAYSGDGVDNVAMLSAKPRNTGCGHDPLHRRQAWTDDNTPRRHQASGARISSRCARAAGCHVPCWAIARPEPLCGLPGCVMYAGATIFRPGAPRIAAGVELTRRDFAVMGEGGLCLGCKPCHWPNCPFGK